MKKIIFLAFLLSLCLYTFKADAQCVNLIHNPTDTTGWLHGSSQPTHQGHYDNDTFVVCNAHSDENNYLYNSFPSTLYGNASTFSMSFDFMIDSNYQCSDGLTFWFFTSSLYQLGSQNLEGGQMGFPDTCAGFALAFRTIGCVDEIYMKKINSTNYHWSSGNGNDTNICPKLTNQMFLTDSQWHHCIVNYEFGYITASFDGHVLMSGYSPIWGTGHFGFMGTNGAGRSRKRLKNIQLCAGLGTPTYSSTNFGTYINRLCNGPQVTVQSTVYNAAYSVKTYYGDGSNDTHNFVQAISGGIAAFSHSYASSGSYTIKQELYNGATLIDSLSFLYENIFCATLPVKFFFDGNADCMYDPSESFMLQPVITEVDSNGIAVDTISSTSGFYYNANGTIGDIYSFKVLSGPGNIVESCPTSGVIYDSLVPGIFIYPIQYFGMTCANGNAYDLSATASIPVTGVHDQWGNVYVQNSYCAPTNGTLTLNYSPKYNGTPSQVTPAPASVTGNSIIWNLSALTATSPNTMQLHYQVNYSGTPLTIADTVTSTFTIDPVAGDANPANNTIIYHDTVKSGCDPNEMWVEPTTCFTDGSIPNLVKFRINFENTGNDTAHNIYVMDTLSSLFDASTFGLEMSTNEMYISKMHDAAGHTILKFDFPKINLLDSSHHGMCDGGLIFTIKTRTGILNGTIMPNRAGIYFDVNDVVMTNTVYTRIDNNCFPLAVTNAVLPTLVEVMPNPARNILTINVANSNSNNTSFTITSTIGQKVMQGDINAGNRNLDISKLSAGIYFITVKGENITKIVKFVKI